MIKANGLEKENLMLTSLFFLNDSIGLATGTSNVVSNLHIDKNDSSKKFDVNQNTFLFKTVDGGKTWKSKNVGDGTFFYMTYEGKGVYALKYTEDYKNVITYYSSDSGSTWVIRPDFPNGIYQIVNYNNSFFSVGRDSKGYSFISKSTNNGLTWKRLSFNYKLFHKITFYQDKIYCLSNSISEQYFPDRLRIFDLNTNSTETIIIPIDFECEFLAINDERIKLIGKKENCPAIYELMGNNNIKLVNLASNNKISSIDGYFQSENCDIMLVSKTTKPITESWLLYSANSNNKWERINFIKDYYVTPFSFFGNHKNIKGWFYSGSSHFQILNVNN